ncbi:MAG TPA: hypothetical protein VGF66_13265, partial [Gaiellaceae bacterium]
MRVAPGNCQHAWDRASPSTARRGSITGTLRSHLRGSASGDALSAVVLAGASVFAAGAIIYFNFDFSLAVVPQHLAPAAAQTLNVLALNMALAPSAGGFVFGIAAGLAIVRGDT